MSCWTTELTERWTLKRWNNPASERTLLFYKALECPDDFVAHGDGISFHVKAGIHLQILEKEPDIAVVSTCERGVLAM